MNRSHFAVWKFPLEITDAQVIQMPVGAQILTAQMQGQSLCLWALCDQDETTYERRTFVVHGTGHSVYAAALHYISTVQVMSGTLVFHVFEIDMPQENET